MVDAVVFDLDGVRSAAAAGMRVVAVPHGSYPLDPDAERLAAVVLPSIDELTTETVNRPGVRFAERPGSE